MTAVDTNVLVRFLTADDAIQAQAVYTLFKKAEEQRTPFFVPLPVVLELLWVLESAYAYSRKEVAATIEGLLAMPVLKIEAEPVVRLVLEDARHTSCELSDLLIGHVAAKAGCDGVWSFDKKACKHALFKPV